MSEDQDADRVGTGHWVVDCEEMAWRSVNDDAAGSAHWSDSSEGSPRWGGWTEQYELADELKQEGWTAVECVLFHEDTGSGPETISTRLRNEWREFHDLPVLGNLNAEEKTKGGATKKKPGGGGGFGEAMVALRREPEPERTVHRNLVVIADGAMVMSTRGRPFRSTCGLVELFHPTMAWSCIA
jgi:hypothetical protein